MYSVFHTARMRPTGRGAWFGVVAILLLQFEFTAHAHHEHEVPLEVESHCEVCLKLDKNGSAPLAQMPSHELPLTGSVELPAQTNPSRANVRYSLPTRGPPAS